MISFHTAAFSLRFPCLLVTARRSTLICKPGQSSKTFQLPTKFHQHQKRMVNTNPATGEEISRIPCTPPAVLNEMVQKAVAAQTAWSNTSIRERIECLRGGLVALAAQSDSLIPLICQEMGKPLAQAREEVLGAVSRDEYLIILSDALQPKQHGSSVVVRHALEWWLCCRRGTFLPMRFCY
jgi:acyl-CoA reductase-like NAD-dependent aldehyde dehydrogenase